MTQENKNNRQQSLDFGALSAGATFIDDKNVISYTNSDGPSFLFMRGCAENYAAQAPIYARKLGALGSLHFQYQLDGEHNQDMINTGIIEACKRDGARDRIFVATSMGLMNTMRSLESPRVRAALGHGSLKAVVSLSGMTSRADLHPSMQRAAGISSRTLQLPVIRQMWRGYRLHKARNRVVYSPNTTLDEVMIHYESSARTPGPLVASQHRAIVQSRAWESGALADVAADNPDMTLHQITADYDGVVDRRAARQSMIQAFGLPVETVVDHQRFTGSHGDDIEFIEQLAQRMAATRGVSYTLAQGAVRLEQYSENSFAGAL